MDSLKQDKITISKDINFFLTRSDLSTYEIAERFGITEEEVIDNIGD